MMGSRLEAELSRWSEHIDGLAVNDEALRVFSNLLCVYLGRDREDQEGIASMASIVVDPEADADEVQSALDTLRESLHSRAAALDFESEDDLSDEEQEASRRMDSEEASFADRLRVVMAEKGMSQVQLAEAVGVGQPAISMMLARECRPQRRTVEKLAMALEVAPQELWPEFAKRAERTELARS